MIGSAIPWTSVDAATALRMSRQRTRDTEPEVLLRRELHRRGLRYRVDAALPGMPRRRADILFTRARTLTPDLGHVESSSCWRKRDDQDHGQEELL